MYRPNSVGDIGQPCFTPVALSGGADKPTPGCMHIKLDRNLRVVLPAESICYSALFLAQRFLLQNKALQRAWWDKAATTLPSPMSALRIRASAAHICPYRSDQTNQQL